MRKKNMYGLEDIRPVMKRIHPQAGVIFKDGKAQSYFYDDITTYRTSRITYDENNFIQFYELETAEKMYKFLEYMQCILRVPEIEV